MPAMNKWEITTDPLMLRRLGKLGEELGELASVTSRCIIQGVDATDPGTGKVNRQRLLDELADVAAQIDCTMTAFGLDTTYFGKRRTTKREQMAEWEALYRPSGVMGVQPQQAVQCAFCERPMIAGSECLTADRAAACEVRTTGVETPMPSDKDEPR